jgi:uracil-DNA glycosylase
VNVTLNLEYLRDVGAIHASWAIALAPVQPQLDEIAAFLDRESSEGRKILPAEENIMRVFSIPVDLVRVLIVGQDPYPTPGHAIGLAFAVDASLRPLPRSLSNIFTELESDIGAPRPGTRDLSAWVQQGVMLLNRALTVRSGEAGSHRRRGWETVTDHAIKVLATRDLNQGGHYKAALAGSDLALVAVLWGKQAASLRPLLRETPVIESAHPSPLSARRGFFGSKPFSRANELLAQQGALPIDWSGS